MNGRITLHSLETGERVCRNAKPADLRFLTFNRFAVRAAQTECRPWPTPAALPWAARSLTLPAEAGLKRSSLQE
jgi:hypothetical protein